mgnify:CR=1 FL=1
MVDYRRCANCGVCSKACPRSIIARVPFASERVYGVACSNRDPGRAMKTVCKVGCISCGVCSKTVPELFAIKANLAEVDYTSYEQGEATPAAEKCPTKVIVTFGNGQQ